MITEVRVPSVSENVKQGKVVSVLVAPGDTVAAEQALIELETDKAVVEIPSPLAGRITEISVTAGETIAIGAVIARLETADAAAVDAAPAATRRTIRRGCTIRRSRTPRGEADRPAPVRPRAGRRAGARPRRRRPVRRRPRPRLAIRAPPRPRTRRGDRRRRRQRPVRPHQRGRREGARAPPARGGRRRLPRTALPRRRLGAGRRPPAARLRAVGPDHARAAVARARGDRRDDVVRLGHGPAGDAVRPGRHHRAGGVPQGVSPRATPTPT